MGCILYNTHNNKEVRCHIFNNILGKGPKSGSWRQEQNSDTEQFEAVRTDVAKREKAGLVLPEIGGHEIIICGQIADYVLKIGINFDLPASIPQNMEIMMDYSMPESEERNMEKALANCGKKVHENKYGTDRKSVQSFL